MIEKIDIKIINFFKKISTPFAKLSFFIIFFWFGFLKVLNLSPASPLVYKLFEKTISGIDFATFFIAFGAFECLIGILFLLPKMERVVIPILFLHLFMTAGPLILLSKEIWTSSFVPTLEGQYIIKNMFIALGAILIASNLRPLSLK